MRPNTNRQSSPRVGQHIKYSAALALTVGLTGTLIACEESPADPAAATALQAAGTISDEDRPGRPMGSGLFRLPEALGLSAEQQAEVEQIRAELREKNEPLHEQIRSTLGISDNESPRRLAFHHASEEQREALRPTFEQVRENHGAAMEKVLAVLTPEQRETLDSLRLERKARWEERRADASSGRGHRGPLFAGGMFRLPSELDLTADQQSAVERIGTALHEKNEPLHEQIRSTLGVSADDSARRFAFRDVTEEQREALRPVFDQLRANHREAMDEATALLTPEQQQTLESLRAERKSRGPGAARFFRGQRSS